MIIEGKVVATLSRFRRISSLMIEVNGHDQFLKCGMIFGSYGLDDDYDVHLVLLEKCDDLGKLWTWL